MIRLERSFGGFVEEIQIHDGDTLVFASSSDACLEIVLEDLGPTMRPPCLLQFAIGAGSRSTRLLPTKLRLAPTSPGETVPAGPHLPGRFVL